MQEKEYEKVMLFMGVLSVKGFPAEIKEQLEALYGPIAAVSKVFPFSFTDYYVPEMGEGIERFFICFENLITPDRLAFIKTETNRIELSIAENGLRKINLDPGTLSDSNIILATTKNRSHRIAIGQKLYAEVTLIYQNHGFQTFPWTYADYRSLEVQQELLSFRTLYHQLRKRQK